MCIVATRGDVRHVNKQNIKRGLCLSCAVSDIGIVCDLYWLKQRTKTGRKGGGI